MTQQDVVFLKSAEEAPLVASKRTSPWSTLTNSASRSATCCIACCWDEIFILD
jgi:hypothetical protein